MSCCKTIGAGLQGLCAVLLAATCITTGAQASAPPPDAALLVAAASDLQLAFADIGRRFEQETGECVNFSFGSSGSLAQQIERGAPVDVFAAADQASLRQLLVHGRVVTSSMQVYAQGRLVLALNRKQDLPVHRPADLLTAAVTHIAIANPEHAPYGRAAQQVLESAGLWEVLAPKIVYAGNVMQAMQYVQQGNAEAAFIASSVAIDPAIRSEPVDPQAYAPLNQTMVLVAGTSHESLARRFMTYVLSQPGQLVLRSYGFGPPEEAAATTPPRPESETGARPLDLFPLFLSLKVAALATAICTGAGLTLAWVLARRRFRGSNLLDAVATLPQVLPPSVLGYYLLTVLGANTGAGRFLESTFGLRIVFTWEGAVIASAVTAFPLMVQSARAAFEQVDPGLEDVARTLGRPEWEVFRRVTVPLAGNGLLAGVVLTFTRALGEFGATLMVAGNIPGQTQTLSLAIYDAVQAGDAGRAVLLVTIVTALTIALLLTARTLANRRQLCSN